MIPGLSCFRQFSTIGLSKKVIQMKKPLEQPSITIKKALVARFNTSEIVSIKNPERVKEKLFNIKTQGAQKLQVVSDFDHTLTQVRYGRRTCRATLGLFKDSKYVSDRYRQTQNDINSKYGKFFYVEELTQDERDKIYYIWLEKTLSNIVDEKITLEQLNVDFLFQRIVKESLIYFRNGTDQFLKTCGEQGIPFYIISAGIQNIQKALIYKLLEQNNQYYPNLHIYSNELLFGSKRYIDKYQESLIHALNKEDILDPKQIQFRPNCILIGDYVYDLTMTKNLEIKNQLSVCIISKSDYENRHPYDELYDILIKNDGNLVFIDLLVEYATHGVLSQAKLDCLSEDNREIFWSLID